MRHYSQCFSIFNIKLQFIPPKSNHFYEINTLLLISNQVLTFTLKIKINDILAKEFMTLKLFTTKPL